MKTETLDKLIWVLIYGGLGTLIVGVYLGDDSSTLAWALMGGGAFATVVGALLIFVRSRVDDRA